MRIVRYLQHWLSGDGPRLSVSEFVPERHRLRLWADTYPWDKMVEAVKESFARRFPKETLRGRFPVSPRVLPGLEYLKAKLNESDEGICSRLRTDFGVMYACGIEEVQVDRSQAHFVHPETLAQFRSRLDSDLMEDLLQIQSVEAMAEGLVSPSHLVVDTFASEQGTQRVTDATTLYKAKKKVLDVAFQIADHLHKETLKQDIQSVRKGLKGVMHSFGRTCRGKRKILVKVVRETEQQLLEVGRKVGALGLSAYLYLAEDTQLGESRQARLQEQLVQAVENYELIEQQSKRLVNGKKLPHAKIVNPYDSSITPIIKGKSNCPAQFGKKPGIIAEMATGFIFGLRLPEGNPHDASYMISLIDKVDETIDALDQRRKPKIHSVAGDLAFQIPTLRDQLTDRGILSVGIPETSASVPATPTPEMIQAAQEMFDTHQMPGVNQIQVAYACGHSRPFVESLIETLSCHGGTHIKYKGHRGAIIQTAVTILACNGDTLVRIKENQISKRAKKFRRFFYLKPPNLLKNKDIKF